MADALAQRLSATATEKRIADRLLTGLDRVHQQVRDLSRGLVPVQVETEGLCAALDDLATRTSEESGIPVTFDCRAEMTVPFPAAATELFRIAQEAVSNALRHARPRHVQIMLLPGPEGLRLNIQDDGSGLRERPGEGKGMGLRIMQFRAEQIGGALMISPAEGGGTVVSCWLPATKVNHHEKHRIAVTAGENPDRG
jgi:signal transduction histidine kinase